MYVYIIYIYITYVAPEIRTIISTRKATRTTIKQEMRPQKPKRNTYPAKKMVHQNYIYIYTYLYMGS